MESEKWGPCQIASWITTLDGGIYEQYFSVCNFCLSKFCFAIFVFFESVQRYFEESEADGSDLPDLDRVQIFHFMIGFYFLYSSILFFFAQIYPIWTGFRSFTPWLGFTF